MSMVGVTLQVGSLTLGDVNKDKCATSAINWHTIRSPFVAGPITKYATQIDQVSYGDHAYPLDNGITWTAEFRPQYEVVSKRVGAKVQIDSYNSHFYPVDSKVKNPDDVKIVMDGKEYVIPETHLIDRFYYPRTCSLNLIATELSATVKSYQFVICSPFLREYCQTYDAANNQIGFSNNTDATEMDTQKVCSGATTLAGLSAIVVATVLAFVAI